jgi:hypothetical protein
MFDGESRKVRIGDEIRSRVSFLEHSLKKRPMLISRDDQPDTWLVEPAVDALASFLD